MRDVQMVYRGRPAPAGRLNAALRAARSWPGQTAVNYGGWYTGTQMWSSSEAMTHDKLAQTLPGICLAGVMIRTAGMGTTLHADQHAIPLYVGESGECRRRWPIHRRLETVDCSYSSPRGDGLALLSNVNYGFPQGMTDANTLKEQHEIRSAVSTWWRRTYGPDRC